MLSTRVERNTEDTKVDVRHINAADTPAVYETVLTLDVGVTNEFITEEVEADLAANSRTGFRVSPDARQEPPLLILPAQDGVTVSSTGSLADMAAIDNSSVAAVRQMRPAIEQTVSAGVYGSNRAAVVPQHRFGINPRATQFFEFKTAITGRKLFCGLASTTGGSILLADGDDPDESYVGVSWSTERSDTKFQFIHRKDAGSSQVITASTVTPVENVPYGVRVKRPTPTTAVIEILDATDLDRLEVLEALVLQTSSDLPPDNALCGWVYCWKGHGAAATMTFMGGLWEVGVS